MGNKTGKVGCRSFELTNLLVEEKVVLLSGKFNTQQDLAVSIFKLTEQKYQQVLDEQRASGKEFFGCATYNWDRKRLEFFGLSFYPGAAISQLPTDRLEKLRKEKVSLNLLDAYAQRKD